MSLDRIGWAVEVVARSLRWIVEARLTYVFEGGEVACVIACPPS